MRKYTWHAYKGAEIILSTITQVTCILLPYNMQRRALTIPSHFFTLQMLGKFPALILAAKGVSDPGSKSLDSCVIHRVTVRKGLQLTWPKLLDLKVFQLLSYFLYSEQAGF